MRREDSFPPGWDEEHVQQVLAHCEGLSEEEAVAENEVAFGESKGTVMVIPQHLVSTVRMLLAERGG